jgi:PAS domain S-box-containing protein
VYFLVYGLPQVFSESYVSPKSPKRASSQRISETPPNASILPNKLPAASTTDINTEREKREKALLESEEKYRVLVENSIEPILVLQNNVMKFSNAAAANLVECTREEMVNAPYADYVSPEDLKKINERIQNRLRLQGTGNVYQYRLMTRKGNARWIETHNVLIKWEGQPAILVFMNDITESLENMERLAKSEEKFSKAFNDSPSVLILSRVSDGKILEFNETLLKLSGYTREEVAGHTVKEMGFWNHPEERAEVMKQFLIDGRIEEHDFEFRAKNNVVLICRFSGEHMEVGGEGCILVSLLDVTQWRKDEETIKNLLARVEHDNEELRRLDKLKNEFISIVAHDLRTPLTSITGYLRLLTDPRLGSLDSQQTEFVGLAYKNAKRLNNLVANFLDLSVMEQGELKLKTREIKLNEVVLEAIKALMNLAEVKHIRLIADLPETGPSVMADPDKMEQVYINLLGNAVKFTPQNGSITVGVRLEAKDGQPGVLGWVKDTGPGIPAKEVEKVFEKFYQIENEETKMVIGTGLGLTICRRIIEAHGGRIWVESIEGQGSNFMFFIPSLETVV